MRQGPVSGWSTSPTGVALVIILSLLLLNPGSLALCTERRSVLSRTFLVGAFQSWLLGGGKPCQAAAGNPALDEPSTTTRSLLRRLEDDILVQPPPTADARQRSGVDNTFFPDFMQGTWEVTQTLVDVSAPLGLVYLGGPNGVESIATKSMEESRKRLNQPVSLQLRYLPTVQGVAEDRIFNTQQRLDAFAGKSVVAAVDYADVAASNRAKILSLPGGRESDPLQTVFIRFKGPAAQKVFVTSHGGELFQNEKSWVGFEGQRSIFALTNENTAPPIFTDSELIWNLDYVDDGHVRGRLRVAGYLNAQSDKLYFDARQRAVSIQDYTLNMRKIS